jgi:hypothetical protein
VTKERTFGTFTTTVVVFAVVAATGLTACCVAFGAPMMSGSMLGSTACAIGSHGSGSLGIASAAEQESTKIAALGVMAPQPLSADSRDFGERNPSLTAELPPSPDPRHGRIRV